MDNTTHNGWTNYATWRVNLEVFSSGGYEGWDADALENLVTDLLVDSASGLSLDYALAFVADVNWHEIAAAYAGADGDC